MDNNGLNEPSDGVIGKIVELFHSSALDSVNKRQFGLFGEWKVLDNGKTQGWLTNVIIVNETVLFYKREKTKVGFKIASPLRYKYMVRLCDYGKK